jgi:hypothetical protein
MWWQEDDPNEITDVGIDASTDGAASESDGRSIGVEAKSITKNGEE